MEFSFDRFYRLNRRAIIWLILFGLLYLLRSFLLLIFLTFIIGYFSTTAWRFLADRLHMSRGFAITTVYVAILIGYVAVVYWVSPNLISEAGKLNDQIPEIKTNLEKMQAEYSQRYPQIAALVQSYLPEEAPETAVSEEDSELAELRRRILLLESLAARADKASPDTAASDPATSDPATSDPAPPKVETPDPTDGEPTSQTESATEQEPPTDEELAQPPPLGTDAPQDPSEPNATSQEIAIAAVPAAAAPTLTSPGAPGPTFIDRQIDRGAEAIRAGLAAASGRVVRFIIQSLLAILFSYLILLDFGRLARELSGLKTSKLRDFYEEAGQPVVNFALAVGRGFQAIAFIAFTTALMAAVVLIIFNVPQVFLLSVIVFVTSLIPIVGVVFELVAIMLVTFNEYGLDYHFWAVLAGMSVVHMIITYALAPVIFGRQFKLNIVLVLIILYLGQRIAGMWGLVLGVPVANYFIRDVFAVPFIEERESSVKRKRTIEIEPETQSTRPEPISPQEKESKA